LLLVVIIITFATPPLHPAPASNATATAVGITVTIQVNMTLLDHELDKVVVYLDPSEFQSTWLGNKAIYRTRMAIKVRPARTRQKFLSPKNEQNNVLNIS
jgi:hypothetical protein